VQRWCGRRDGARTARAIDQPAMELEFHQLDLRYHTLRVHQPARERRLLASLADVGQQMPIVVVTTDARYLVVDGHKRVRCLHRLHRDTVAAVIWEMAACEALIFRHLLHSDATENVFEQAWLLRTLHEEHGLAGRRRATLRSERELGVAAPQSGPYAPGHRAAARPRWPPRRARRDEVSRGVGARQRRGVPPAGHRDRAASSHNAADRPPVSALCRRS
jgi:hypothetical protein